MCICLHGSPLILGGFKIGYSDEIKKSFTIFCFMLNFEIDYWEDFFSSFLLHYYRILNNLVC